MEETYGNVSFTGPATIAPGEVGLVHVFIDETAIPGHPPNEYPAFTMRFSYDPAVVEVLSVTRGPAIDTSFFSNWQDQEQNGVAPHVALTANTSHVFGTGEIAVIEFRGVDEGGFSLAAMAHPRHPRIAEKLVHVDQIDVTVGGDAVEPEPPDARAAVLGRFVMATDTTDETYEIHSSYEQLANRRHSEGASVAELELLWATRNEAIRQ